MIFSLNTEILNIHYRVFRYSRREILKSSLLKENVFTNLSNKNKSLYTNTL